MFEYTFPTNKPITIKTPEVNDFSEVKTECTTTSTSARTVATYPNGVIFDTTTYIDKIVVRCNHKIIDNGDNTYFIS